MMSMMMKKTLALTIVVLFGVNIYLCQSEVVEYLPGFDGKLPFRLETGYIGVGENEEIQLFYYFVESENNPEDDPLLLWMEGGPGCSGISGLLYEKMGPLRIDYAKTNGRIPVLREYEYSWTKVASVIFIDQPVGTGFSYANTSEAYYSNDTLSATHNYDFIRKWLIKNPKYQNNPLYIGGISYCGIFVPLLVDRVFDGIENGNEPQINLKGYVLGNPATNKYNDSNWRFQYANQMGLISDELYQLAKETCDGDYECPGGALCENVKTKIHKCLEKINMPHILEPWCGLIWKQNGCVRAKNHLMHGDHPTNFRRSASEHLVSNEELTANFMGSAVTTKYTRTSIPDTTTRSWCQDDKLTLVDDFLSNPSVQKALHIREGTKTKWQRCNSSISAGSIIQDRPGMPYVGDVLTTLPYHMKFTHKSCRVLIFSGDHDLIVPRISTKGWIDSLKLPTQSDWRPWFAQDQIAGYTMTYALGDYELTYATLKGAGHVATKYKPMEMLVMMRNWFRHSPI